MKDSNDSLPMFGIGPIYVVVCFIITLIGVILSYYGYLNYGIKPQIRILMLVIGVVLIAIGIVLWVNAVIIQRINIEVKKGKLITNGVYSLVRNPIYSAFIHIYTGIIFISNNIILLVLPLFYWIFITILLKKTEEKWLREKFGEEYEIYCKDVNRIIPCFKTKKYRD